MLLSNCFDPDPRVHAEARSLVSHGYRVTILGWDRDRKRPETETIDDIEVMRVFPRSSHGRGAAQALVMPRVFAAMIGKARRLQFDIVHAHDFDMLPLGLAASWLRRVPLIYDSHEDYVGMLHGSIPGWLASLIRAIESVLLRRADLLITVGDKLRDSFLRRGCRRAEVVGNWKPLQEYRLPPRVRADVRRQLAIPDSALVVSFIANLGRERHIAELVHAVTVRPKVHLIIGGGGPEADMVARAAGEHPNVHFLGFVKPAEISRYTCASDVLFYGFDVANPNAQYSAPNKLFEALAAGRPLISAHFGEIEGILQKHACGILMDNFSGEEIGRALDACADQARLKAWGERAAAAGEQQFNWAIAEGRLLDSYARLLSRVGVREAV